MVFNHHNLRQNTAKENMRELKFRAWNGDMMSKPFEMNQMLPDNCGGFIDSDGISIYWDSIENDGGCVMQYTGLKDKNGKEIFEDDIVSYYSEEEDKKYYHRVMFGKVPDGEGHSGWYGRNDLYPRHMSPVPIFDKDEEVEGNIYENPELLTLQS